LYRPYTPLIPPLYSPYTPLVRPLFSPSENDDGSRSENDDGSGSENGDGSGSENDGDLCDDEERSIDGSQDTNCSSLLNSQSSIEYSQPDPDPDAVDRENNNIARDNYMNNDRDERVIQSLSRSSFK
jgi:hypothetical protein